jgi:hypothetical protein
MTDWSFTPARFVWIVALVVAFPYLEGFLEAAWKDIRARWGRR